MRTELSKVLQAGVDWTFVEINPARGIRIGDRGPKTERLYLNSSEVLRLLTANVYTHAIPESQRRAVDKVAEVLFADVRETPATLESQTVN